MDKHPVLMKINVPLCVRRCSFCPREVITGRDSGLIHDYVMALAVELKANAEEFADCQVQAIRLGGGCASIIDGADFEKLIRLIRSCYDVAQDAPVTLRVSPADINGANMPFYNRSHVSRYDLEMISLEPLDFMHLDYLNYMEQLPYIASGFLRADRRPVMGNVLLYGKKTVSKWGFRHSVLETARRSFCHVIFQRCAGEDALDDAAAAAQLLEGGQILAEHGFTEYLPGYFAKPGSEDVFFSGAAKGMDVLAFGLNAKTRFGGALTVNTGDMQTYLRSSGDFAAITADAQAIGEEA